MMSVIHKFRKNKTRCHSQVRVFHFIHISVDWTLFLDIHHIFHKVPCDDERY